MCIRPMCCCVFSLNRMDELIPLPTSMHCRHIHRHKQPTLMAAISSSLHISGLGSLGTIAPSFKQITPSRIVT